VLPVALSFLLRLFCYVRKNALPTLLAAGPNRKERQFTRLSEVWGNLHLHDSVCHVHAAEQRLKSLLLLPIALENDRCQVGSYCRRLTIQRSATSRLTGSTFTLGLLRPRLLRVRSAELSLVLWVLRPVHQPPLQKCICPISRDTA